MLENFGSDWITAGTAPRTELNSVAITSTTPPQLMSEYISARIYDHDPWISYSAEDAAVNEMNLQDMGQDKHIVKSNKLPQLFQDFNVRHVVLVPSWNDARPGGIVMYSTSGETAKALQSRETRTHLLACVSAVAAWFRPEMLAYECNDKYLVRPRLNPREIEVLQWLSTGLSTKEIAWRMAIADVTVSKHFQSARCKLGARTREQALALAIRDGFVQL